MLCNAKRQSDKLKFLASFQIAEIAVLELPLIAAEKVQYILICSELTAEIVCGKWDPISTFHIPIRGCESRDEIRQA